MVALPPSRDLSGVPSSCDQALVDRRPGRRRRGRRAPRAISPLTAADRPRHVEPPKPRAAVAQVDRLAACPSRRRPGRSPGRARRLASTISASTVGRPRESQTRRPITLGNRVVHAARSARLRPGLAAISPRSSDGGSSERLARRARTAALSSSVGDVFDRRLAVDAGQQEARQQRVRHARSRPARGSQLDAGEIGVAPAPSKPPRKPSAPAGRPQRT